MLSESGIDLDFDVFAEIEQDHKCYELKAKSLTPSRGNPMVLMDPDMVKIKPDPDTEALDESFGHLPMNRTTFKQLMQREQLLEAEKKEKERLKILAAQYERNYVSFQSQKVSLPSISSSQFIPNAPSAAMPMKSVRTNLPTTVPSSVLKVETSLKNPTPYYIKEQQKRQLQKFLSNQQQQANNGMPVSAPSALRAFNFTSEVSSPSFLNPSSSSSFMVPNSPDTASSVASESEVDSVLDDLFGLETSADHEFTMFSDAVFSPATLPTSNNLFETYGLNDLPQEKSEPLSTSCPVKQEVSENFVKDRQKKDNHNMIERRRRYNINDRIKELGTLVPRMDNDFKQNKGTILKSSVDYIRRLRKDRDRLKQYESRSQSLEDINKKLMLRVQELELILRAANISSTLPEPDITSAASPQLTQLLVGSQLQQLQQLRLQTQKQQQQQQQQLQQQMSQLPANSTLHNLLKSPPGTSSETVATCNSSSIDSPGRNIDMINIDDDEDTIGMES